MELDISFIIVTVIIVVVVGVFIVSYTENTVVSEPVPFCESIGYAHVTPLEHAGRQECFNDDGTNQVILWERQKGEWVKEK